MDNLAVQSIIQIARAKQHIFSKSKPTADLLELFNRAVNEEMIVLADYIAEQTEVIGSLNKRITELEATEERIETIIEQMETLPQELVYRRGVAYEFRSALEKKK